MSRNVSVKEVYEYLIKYYSSYHSLPGVYVENLIKEKMSKGLSREEAILELYNEISRKVLLEETSIEEIYKWIVDYYTSLNYTREDVERILEAKIARGLTREEAIIELYREVYPHLARRKVPGIIDFFTSMLKSFPKFSSISISVFVGDSVKALADFIGIVAIILIVLKFEELGFLNRLLAGDLTFLSDPSVIGIVLLFFLIISVVQFFVNSLSRALYSTVLYPQAYNLLVSGNTFFEKSVSFGIFQSTYLAILLMKSTFVSEAPLFILRSS